MFVLHSPYATSVWKLPVCHNTQFLLKHWGVISDVIANVKNCISDTYVDYATDIELLQVVSLSETWSLILPRTQPNIKQLLPFSGSSMYPA